MAILVSNPSTVQFTGAPAEPQDPAANQLDTGFTEELANAMQPSDQKNEGGAAGEKPKSNGTLTTSFLINTSSTAVAGKGGDGKSVSWITPAIAASNVLGIGQTSSSLVYFAGGGGGGMGADGQAGGPGGLGGGATGTRIETSGNAGTANTGGGGGGVISALLVGTDVVRDDRGVSEGEGGRVNIIWHVCEHAGKQLGPHTGVQQDVEQ